MKVIYADNVNDAFKKALYYMADHAVLEYSRNGEVAVAPGPVCTVYDNPDDRVLFSPKRDANPFFHVMEALWMLHGDNDVVFPTYFNANMSKYSDDTVTFWGAYGHRWREFFGYDQLARIVDELKADPNSRRAVLAMWNAWGPEDSGMELQDDLCVASHGGLDVPCNTHVYFDCRGGRLNMTVCNRSNDIVWGAYGANYVHMSFLQEFIATSIDMEIGQYRQFSNNFHIYTEKLPKEKWGEWATDSSLANHYETDVGRHWRHVSLIDGDFEMQSWDGALEFFMTQVRKLMADPMFYPTANFVTANNFLTNTAWPMFMVWRERKAGRDILTWLNAIEAPDWKLACENWIVRHLSGAPKS